MRHKTNIYLMTFYSGSGEREREREREREN
jgi:hypothetical protein